MEQISGDPTTVRERAAAMVKAAERMTRAAATLDSLSAGSHRSEAVDAVDHNSAVMASQLRRASTRFRGTGLALQDYAEVLDHAQRETALAVEQHAATDVGGARWDLAAKELDVHNPLLALPGREADLDRAHMDLDRARRECHQQEVAADAAEARYNRARDDLDQAAEQAIRRIHLAAEESGLRDSVWDDAGGWFDRHVDDIKAVIDDIGGVLTVAAILFAWVPVLGQVLTVAAVVVTLASLALTVYQFARDQIGPREMLVTGVFAMLSVVPGLKAARTLGKIKAQGEVGAAMSRGTSRRLQNPDRIFFRSDPGEVALPGASKSMRQVLGREYGGILPDKAEEELHRHLQKGVTDLAKGQDARDRGDAPRIDEVLRDQQRGRRVVTWVADLRTPSGWELSPLDDGYQVQVRAQEDDSSVVAVGVVELARDTDLALLKSDLDLVDPGHGPVLIRRTVNMSTHRGRDVLRAIDVSYERGAPEGEREVRRTYCGYVRDRRAGLVIRLEVATVDMLALDDMDDVCTSVLASVVLREQDHQ